VELGVVSDAELFRVAGAFKEAPADHPRRARR